MLPLVLDNRVRLSGEAKVVEWVPDLAIIEINVDQNNKFDNFGTSLGINTGSGSDLFDMRSTLIKTINLTILEQASE